MRAGQTEASAQAVRAFRGASGLTTIRGGTRTLELSPVAALTFYLDVDIAINAVGRLAQAVADAGSLEEANDALHVLGVSTELDYERDAAGARSARRPLERRRVVDALALRSPRSPSGTGRTDPQLAVHVLGRHRHREHVAALHAHVVVGTVAREDGPIRGHPGPRCRRRAAPRPRARVSSRSVAIATPPTAPPASR